MDQRFIEGSGVTSTNHQPLSAYAGNSHLEISKPVVTSNILIRKALQFQIKIIAPPTSCIEDTNALSNTFRQRINCLNRNSAADF